MAGGFEIKEYPEKSWSISKMKTIDNCFREYYYTYYGSHNGWIYESTDEQKLAWRLKKLTNIYLMFGDKLHIVIKKIIENNTNEEKIINIKDYMRSILNMGVKSSVEKLRTGEWDEYPKGEMLQEYYYGDKLEKETIDQIKERINLCIDNFFKCKTYNEIKLGTTTVLEVDEGKFDFIFISGVKVFALIDALYIDKEGNYVIVDWKTGKVGEFDRDQVLVYALYVMEKYNVPLEKIKGRVEYLLSEENIEYKFTSEDIEYIKNKVQQDLNVINAFLIDKELNIPRDKEYFIKSDNLKKCRKCKFRKMCLGEEYINEVNRHSSTN